MTIFALTYRQETVEETTIYVEADDEKLLRQKLDDIEDCLDDQDWRVCDGEFPELQCIEEMTQKQIALYWRGPPIHKEHHFHYEDPEPVYEAPDPRQLSIPLAEKG
jgi:hypothetical protein